MSVASLKVENKNDKEYSPKTFSYCRQSNVL